MNLNEHNHFTLRITQVFTQLLSKAHYNVMCRVMKPFEVNVLAGRAKSVDAKHYAMYELNEILEKYAEARKKFNISVV